MHMTTVLCAKQFLLHTLHREKELKNLSKENGVIPRKYGNKGCLPPNSFSFENVRNIVDFITNYVTVFGLPQPAARRGRASTAPVYLPATEGTPQVVLSSAFFIESR